jgi:hypothetical protein
MKTRSGEKAEALLALLVVLAGCGLILAACAGYVLNIVTLAQTMDASPLGLLVLRVVGIFIAPLGAILGFV